MKFVFEPSIPVSELENTVNDFLSYIETKPAGNRALYITGEPGCGKDHTIHRCLDKRESYREQAPVAMTFGTHMDIEDFKQTFDLAHTSGQVMVISE